MANGWLRYNLMISDFMNDYLIRLRSTFTFCKKRKLVVNYINYADYFELHFLKKTITSE